MVRAALAAALGCRSADWPIWSFAELPIWNYRRISTSPNLWLKADS
jgi:hypothetical protein